MEVVWDYPHPSLVGSHEDGATEPWIAEVVCALLRAKGADGHPLFVVELGGFVGTTTAWLALTLARIGAGSRLVVVEPDAERRQAIEQRMAALGDVTPVEIDPVPSPQIIATFPDNSIDLAFVDNDHTKLHVEQEICALWTKMKPGGVICLHDVWGVCDLQTVVRKYGGIALDLPRLGPAGGLGIIQIPNV